MLSKLFCRGFLFELGRERRVKRGERGGGILFELEGGRGESGFTVRNGAGCGRGRGMEGGRGEGGQKKEGEK